MKRIYRKWLSLTITAATIMITLIQPAIAENIESAREGYYEVYPISENTMHGSAFPVGKQSSGVPSYDASTDAIKAVTSAYTKDARVRYVLNSPISKSYKYAKLLFKYGDINTTHLGWTLYPKYSKAGWQLYPTKVVKGIDGGKWFSQIVSLNTYDEEFSEIEHFYVWNNNFLKPEVEPEGRTDTESYLKYITFFENKDDALEYDLSIKKFTINGYEADIDNVAHRITFNVQGKNKSIFGNAKPEITKDPLAKIQCMSEINYVDDIIYKVTNVLGEEITYTVTFNYGYAAKKTEGAYVIPFDSVEAVEDAGLSIYNYNLSWDGQAVFDEDERALNLTVGWAQRINLRMQKTIPGLSEYKYARVRYKYNTLSSTDWFVKSGIGFGSYSENMALFNDGYEWSYGLNKWLSEITDISALTGTAAEEGGLRLYLANTSVGNGSLLDCSIKYVALFKTYEEAAGFEEDFSYVSITQNGNAITAKMNYQGTAHSPKLMLAIYKDGKLISVKETDTVFEGKMSLTQNSLTLEEGEYQAKAFVWKNDGSIYPYYESASELVTAGSTEYDLDNSRENEWQEVPVVSNILRNKGVEGGEGGQAILYVTTDTTGEIVMSFSDAGQIFISSDGGETWERGGRNVNAGSLSNGEIDPNNSKRVVGYTYSGIPAQELASVYSGTGIYISEDMGYSFEQTLSYCEREEGWRIAFAWDPTSYDAKIGGSSICYFTTCQSEISNDNYGNALKFQMQKGYNEGPGFYRSTDGGYSWELVNKALGASPPAVCPKDGSVFAASADGLYRSRDKGDTWEKVIDGNVGSVTTILSKPENVYINDDLGVLISTDCGETFTRVENSTFPRYQSYERGTTNLKVSNANPNYMMISYDPYQFGGHIMSIGSYYSHDGGATWTRTGYDTSYDFYNHQPRWKVTAWDPVNPNKVWTNSDWVELSWDGGKTFRWNNNGNCGTCINSPFILNVYNPDRFLIPAQDNRGAYTLDGGETFKTLYLNNSLIKGHNYGGYIVDENTFFFCTTGTWEAPESALIVTHDGGETFTEAGTVTCGARNNYCFQSQVNPDVYFAGNLRSSDGGYTWEALPDEIMCVATYNPYGNELFAIGKGYGAVYKSVDTGETWRKLFDRPLIYNKSSVSGINLLAYDGVNDILYFTQADTISKYKDGVITKLNCDIMKDKWRTSLAVDPRYPDIIYTGGVPNGTHGGFSTYDMTRSIFRSCDGGKTWQTISSADTRDSIVKTGPLVGNYYTWAMFVHPETGYVYAGMPNYGLYKFAPPYEVK